jgi:hypothetical protein
MLPWAGAISFSRASYFQRGAAGPRETGWMPTSPQPFGSGFSSTDPQNETRQNMNIFAIIGVVVVVLAVLG